MLKVKIHTYKDVHLYIYICVYIVFLLLTASGYVLSGSGTTIYKKPKLTQTLKTIHNTQNYKHNKTKLQTQCTQNCKHMCACVYIYIDAQNHECAFAG
jgi:hypothetical protein